MTEKKMGIIDKYNGEILGIKNKLNDLEKGRIYEITSVRSDGYLSTNIIQLRKMIEGLIFKIEYGKKGESEELAEIMNQIKL